MTARRECSITSRNGIVTSSLRGIVSDKVVNMMTKQSPDYEVVAWGLLRAYAQPPLQLAMTMASLLNKF